MKILLLHGDKYPWASTHRAEALKKEWINDEVDILSFWDRLGKDYDVVQVVHSGGMTRIKDYLLANRELVFTTLASQRTLDGIFDNKKDLIKIYKQTVCCVALNQILKAKLLALDSQINTVYIPNGVDTELFNNSFIVGFVGAKDSHEHKGYELVCRACDELGLTLETISGNVPIDKMPDFYRQIDCLVIPSESEGCNNPTLEALAMNKPVISTKVGIVADLEGVILVDRTVDSIKQALKKLSGRLQMVEKYTWKKVATQYHALYDRIM